MSQIRCCWLPSLVRVRVDQAAPLLLGRMASETCAITHAALEVSFTLDLVLQEQRDAHAG